MVLSLALVVFVCLAAGIFGFGYVHYVKPSQLLDQLKTSTTQIIEKSLAEGGAGKPSSSASLFRFLGELMPASPQDAAMARAELIASGFRGPNAVQIYYGTKFCGAALLLLLSLFLRARTESPIVRLALPVGGAVAGFMLPAFVLGKFKRRRKERIRFALPDALDLLVICTEAGCGLDQAMLSVSRDLAHVHPAMAEEFNLLNMEVTAGKSRADALRNLSRRTSENEVKKLVAILIQTDRFGTSVSEALRTQSDFLRVRRRQEAEERAGKVGVKLVFPIFFFCLPSLLVVTAGPGMIQLFTNLIPLMNHSGR